MNLKSLLECERKSLMKISKYQLPNGFKKIGLGILIISFISLFSNKFLADSEAIRIFSKYGMLIGFLIISVSKEKIEDELITKIRMQSYTFSFVFGVFFSLLQPFINYSVDSIFQSGEAVFKDNGDFQILWLLLSVQVLFFEFLKKLHK